MAKNANADMSTRLPLDPVSVRIGPQRAGHHVFNLVGLVKALSAVVNAAMLSERNHRQRSQDSTIAFRNRVECGHSQAPQKIAKFTFMK